MPSKLFSTTSDTKKDAIATLMYHCGVAVEMRYEPNQSCASSGLTSVIKIRYGEQFDEILYGKISAYSAFKNIFGFDVYGTMRYKLLRGTPGSACQFGPRYSDDEWAALLKESLDEYCPLYYAGGGHAFICDGYDAQGRFHFNWG